ncbi:MAG: hypothetical protein KBT48_05605 [Firmicutes bacterium]|nr:hypothetical protein [Bacillota bacterium]
MKYVFFPGCRIKEGYSDSSKKLAEYIDLKLGIKPAGCCKVDYSLLEEEDCAILICNNCANDLESLSSNQNKKYVWEIIDEDVHFPFPNYHGKKMLIQDCDHGYNDKSIAKRVRSLLTKMNIEFEEMDSMDSIEYGLTREAHRQKVANNAQKYENIDIVTYCAICNLAMNKNAKKSSYLLDLLFEKE